MKRKKRAFKEMYSIDPANQAYMIEVALDQYTDIFSEWDPAPFKRRDLDADLKLYLEESSAEIPFKYPIEICFTLPPERRNEAMEPSVRTGLQNGINFKLYLLRRELKVINTRTLRYVLAGLVTLVVARLLSEPAEQHLLTAVLDEGLFIGGWVFLWEAVSLFFFSNRDLYYQYRTYQRLQRAPVLFKAADSSGEAPA
ncbi:hypothetical protein [Trichothermofontia sp.]